MLCSYSSHSSLEGSAPLPDENRCRLTFGSGRPTYDLHGASGTSGGGILPWHSKRSDDSGILAIFSTFPILGKSRRSRRTGSASMSVFRSATFAAANFAVPSAGFATSPFMTLVRRFGRIFAWVAIVFHRRAGSSHAVRPLLCASPGVRSPGASPERPDPSAGGAHDDDAHRRSREKAADRFGTGDGRSRRFLERFVDAARRPEDLGGIRRIGIDETSTRKRHKHITAIRDFDADRAIFASPGRDKTTIRKFVRYLIAHGGDPCLIARARMDMSPACIAGMREFLPDAEVVFDKFRVASRQTPCWTLFAGSSARHAPRI